MKNKAVNILGVNFDCLTIEQANNEIIRLVETSNSQKSAVVVEPYVEFLSLANTNTEILNILNEADLCLADGTSIQWAGSYLYGKPVQSGSYWSVKKTLLFSLQSTKWRNQVFPEKMAGVTQTKLLLKMLEKKGLRVGIVGGSRPGEVESEVRKLFPKLKLVKVWHGYFSRKSESEIIDLIKKAKIDVLFVAMGFPRQELFMSKYKKNGLAKVMIGEGGSFDYHELGGPVRRAPKFMQHIGLEWLWRLLRQPTRIKRQLAIFKFIKLIRQQKKDQN